VVFLDEEGEEMSIIGYGRGQNQTAVYIVQNPTGRPGRTVKAVDGLSEEKASTCSQNGTALVTCCV